MSIRHFLSPILRRFRSGSGNGEMESGAENGTDDDNDIFDVLDDKENHERGQSSLPVEDTRRPISIP